MKRKTSIIIITYNHLDYTKECIKSIYEYTEKGSFEIIIVDNHSEDDTRNWLKKQKNLKVIFNEENLGFPKACNQGIELADRQNDILLLNNDTIVTENWLKNLKICLNSSSLVGAVGSVCNHNENEQGCDFIYDDFEKMQQLAKKNNQSDKRRWEEKVFLIGFCILIKKEVMDQIKNLDIEYSPGYIEDNDLSLRIIEKGYKLMLCHDSFIHHYLGSSFRKDLDKFYHILNKNRKYFIHKWGFSPFAFDEVKHDSLKIIENPTKVLEFNCGIAPTILKMKYQYPNMLIHGIESDFSKREIAKHLGIIYSSLEEVKDHDYDCIIIGDLLEKVVDPKEFLFKLKDYLTPTGSVVAKIQNIASIEQISLLLNQKFYQQERLHHYTISDLEHLLEEEGYKLDFIYSWYKKVSEEEEELIHTLKKIKDNSYEIVCYSIRFSKIHS